MSWEIWTPYRRRKISLNVHNRYVYGSMGEEKYLLFCINTIFVKWWTNLNEYQYFPQLKVLFYIIQ